MKPRKSNLDEMQEQKLLKIEHNVAWLGWYGLLAAMLIQLLVFGAEGIGYLLGEWVVFLVMCVYMVIDCIRNGVWDRYIRPDDTKTNMTIAAIASLVGSAVIAIVLYRAFGSLLWSLVLFGAFFVWMMVCCWACVRLSLKAYRKRLAQLENIQEEG